MVLNARDRDEFVFFVRDATKNMIAQYATRKLEMRLKINTT